MRKIIILFATAASVMLNVYAQDTWNAVKVFDFDLEDAGNVYEMYIDSVGATDGNAVFCFQVSTQKLIKTDSKGNVIEVTSNPYADHTIYNGDTLYITYPGVVVNTTSGDTVLRSYGRYICRDITASSSGIYVFLFNTSRGPSIVKSVLTNEKIFETYYFNGFCASKDGVYIFESKKYDDVKCYLNYVDVKTGNTVQTIHTISEPKGIAEFRGSLYVYSLTDRSVYRLESPSETSVYSITELKTNSDPVHYGLDGRKIEYSIPGIHILKYPDGKVNKIVVR